MVTITDSQCVFELVYPSAHEVYLVGDFHGRPESTMAMQADERGVWRAVMKLPPGTYRFGYLTDGAWVNDYAAFGLEPNANGQWDSILLVPEPRPVRKERRCG